MVALRWNPQGKQEREAKEQVGTVNGAGGDERDRFQLTTVRETFTRQMVMVRLLKDLCP